MHSSIYVHRRGRVSTKVRWMDGCNLRLCSRSAEFLLAFLSTFLHPPDVRCHVFLNLAGHRTVGNPLRNEPTWVGRCDHPHRSDINNDNKLYVGQQYLTSSSRYPRRFPGSAQSKCNVLGSRGLPASNTRRWRRRL